MDFKVSALCLGPAAESPPAFHHVRSSYVNDNHVISRHQLSSSLFDHYTKSLKRTPEITLPSFSSFKPLFSHHECQYRALCGQAWNLTDRSKIIEWAFGKRMTPAERLRKHQRALEKTQRELDRERVKLENQEKKLVQDIKKSAKNGQMGAVRIQAKDLVRTRRCAKITSIP
jgi:hypothetical protein